MCYKQESTRINRRYRGALIVVAVVITILITNGASLADEVGRIQPFHQNPAYWQYKNRPVLLLGGTSEDNLFQLTSPELEKELDRLVNNGGNYVRCTMSSRDAGNIYPFQRDAANQQFDLEQWNPEYWQRFDAFLQATRDREIIVQIEMWATYDFYSRSSHMIDGKTAWERNPFNPVNNINYSEAESGLFDIFRSNGQELINPFFNTVLPLPEPFDFNVRPKVLAFQHKFIDQLLATSLKYDHVLYCIDNETQADPKWSIYWSQYVRKKAAGRNTPVQVTEMFDPFDPTGGSVEGAVMQSPATHFFTLRSNVSVTLNDPGNFTFLDISNHNAQAGQVHFETGYYIWKKVQESEVIRPVNNVKIYGAGDGGWNGSAKDGQERFWRNVFAGAASVRFHRPDAGLGDSDVAMSHIKSMRMLTDAMWVFTCTPRNDLLTGRTENEAYCLAEPGKQYAVYFPDGGAVSLDVPATEGALTIHWLDIGRSAWLEPESVSGEMLQLQAPGGGHWAALVSPAK